MSEYTQVDLQIGTEAQFETKKADLAEGVLVGLTDPIHENELDSALQTKLDGIKKVYQHHILLEGTENPSRIACINIINTEVTPYTFDTFRAALATTTSYDTPFNGLPVVSTRKFYGGPPVCYDIYDAIQTTNESSSASTITIYFKEAYDTNISNMSTQELISGMFTDTVTEL